ncbi:Fe-S cluster assembly protein HesB [Flaviaesturariibacter flavus]|uniref:Fe-S cluster assembly protein HesB n=1 Tax=Flaviaesturariibacter flavus TaxID=2502780 RepID=A0A4R1BPX7_9BACT|nr:Fe-S cluster assembly protein HesB [Flaviaesturariibacter flavus]TCJ19326.1 Fe-S cluster assembly protein HesB [Flaviaesturariibacter flavus]
MKEVPDDNKAFVLEVHRLLTDVYGSEISYFHDLDPLSELVSALLSHRTRNRDSGAAFRRLRERFADWESVRDAPVGEVEETISVCTWPEQKAPRIQQVLRLLTERLPSLNLDFLEAMPVAAARAWLEALPGVGPKTSAAVLSFSTIRGRAMPVDAHHFRVAVRLGIIEEKLGEARAHKVLEDLLPEYFTAQEVYDHHQVMMRHGQKTCYHFRPDCARCTLLHLCPTGQVQLQKKRA